MNEYTSQLEEKLQAQGFETFTDHDGMLGVRRGEKYLGSIGSHGEFYCNSKDLSDPLWKHQIEKVMQSIESVNTQRTEAPGTVTETTVPEPTIPPFVVDGAFAYSKEEFITMLEQRLVNTDCPACLEYNYEKLSSSDNRLLVYYNILSDGNSREYVASLDLWMNAQSGEIQVIRIVFGSDDPAQVPLIRQFANACVSIIDPTMQTDIYATVSDKGTFAVYDILNYYGTIHNEVAYILKTMNQSDGDSMFAPCDLLIQTKAFLEEDDPGFYKILAEWLESV